MGLRINTNIISLKAQRSLSTNASALQRAMERLASGSRINKAGDDAAGLAVSEGLRSQVRGLTQAVRNANDGVGFLQTAEGALQESTNIAQRIRELAIQSANGSISASDRANLNNEAQSLIEEFDRIATSTEFNGVFLLDGSFTTQDLQVGTRKGQKISFNIGNARASQMGAQAVVSGIQHSLSAVSNAITLNGIAISQALDADDTVSYAGNSYSAIAVAKRINDQQGSSGVYADVQANIVRLGGVSFTAFRAGSTAGTLASGEFMINGVSVTGNIQSNQAFVTAVNSVSNQTGVKAYFKTGSTDTITLQAADGRNISLFVNSSITNATAGFQNAGFITGNQVAASTSFVGADISVNVSYGTSISNGLNVVLTGAVKLRSSNAITIAGTGVSTALGFSAQTTAIDTSIALSSVDVSTQEGASNALAIVDVVIRQLSNTRAAIGAVQNRLDYSVNNLSVTSENLNAAQSQIRDADIALETAELTKNQILQQAGIAVLGQANTSAQAALQLLRFQ